MASMSDIKRRRASIESTETITKAMKLVSTVKLQRAKKVAEDSKEYFNSMYETVSSLLSTVGSVDHPYINGNKKGKKAVILISSNRGLAGGYNGNIVREVRSKKFEKNNTVFYTIGNKGKETVHAKGYEIARDYAEIGEKPSYAYANKICREIMTAYNNEEISEIYIAYTIFKNTVVHIPVVKQILPIEKENIDLKNKETKNKMLMNFELEEGEALMILVPKYITSMIYGAMVESIASENGARMQAMDAATSNAEEMIDKLTLLYNRARQSSITQELTEIIAGADAIG